MPASPPAIPPRVLVVGCGSIGQRHLRNLLGAGVTDVLAFDPRADRRAEVGRELHVETVPILSAAWGRRPEAVVVATPTHLHVPIAIEAARLGCALLIEKPLSHRIEGVDELIKLVRDRQLTTLVGCNMRFHPGLQAVRRLIDEGAVGRILTGRAEFGYFLPNWRPHEDYRTFYSARRDQGGGVILDAIHEIDYLQWLLGGISEIACFAGTLSRLEIDVEDTAAMIVRFAGGAIGEIHIDYLQPVYRRQCHIVGERGLIDWDYVAREVRWSERSGAWQSIPCPTGWEPNDMYVDEIRHFLACVAGTERPVQDLTQAARTLAVACGAKASADARTVIALPPPLPAMDRAARRRVVGIVQARMASTRLPGKVLADIAGRPMLWHVLNRLRSAACLDHIVVATSSETADDLVAEFCREHGVHCYRGSEHDVLDRFYHAAAACSADVVVRITGDCPLLDPQVTKQMVDTFLQGGYDYVTNTQRRSYPDGMDVEVFSKSALERAWHEARRPAEREHVTPYLKTGAFRVRSVESSPLPASDRQVRLTVDTPDDLAFVRAVYDLLGPASTAGLAELRQLVERKPSLLDLNTHLVSNEGYYRSLAQEPPLPPKTLVHEVSMAYRARADQVIAKAGRSGSDLSADVGRPHAAPILARASGSRVWDLDGNAYIDCVMRSGDVILGHDYPAVSRAVQAHVGGDSFCSHGHPLEVKLAERLVELVPCADQVRFARHVTDVWATGIRLARASTGRTVVVRCESSDDRHHAGETGDDGDPAREAVVRVAYDDLAGLDRVFREFAGRLAAFMLDPLGPAGPTRDFLSEVRSRSRQEGAVLVFDETRSVPRVSPGGVQEFVGIVPDLACLGSAIANGHPLAALVGRRELMERLDERLCPSSWHPAVSALAAGLATLAEVRERPIVGHLWSQGQKLQDGFNILAREFGVDRHARCAGHPTRATVAFRAANGAAAPELARLFRHACLERGVWFAGDHNVSYSHSEADVDATLRAHRGAMELLLRAIQSAGVVAGRGE